MMQQNYTLNMTVAGNTIVVNEVPDEVLASLAKKNCKMCYGRAVLNFSNPDGLESQVVCKCAWRRFDEFRNRKATQAAPSH